MYIVVNYYGEQLFTLMLDKFTVKSDLVQFVSNKQPFE